ncbi:MAG: glycosyltransferase family 87 protein [Bacteroidota bacterium]
MTDGKFINTKLWKYPNLFIVVMTLFFLVFFIIQNINGRFWLHDFEVYYSAANSFLSGTQVYKVLYCLGSGYYKYSPFALLIYIPLSILPFTIAKIIYFFLLAGLIICTIIFANALVSQYLFKTTINNPGHKILFFTALIVSFQVYYELHLGNVNILLLLVFLGSLHLLLKNKEYKAGILIALGILIKPHFIVLLPLLLLRKKFKSFLTFFVTFITGLLLPALFVGIKQNNELHRQWFSAMSAHNTSLTDSQDTIYSWLYRLMFRSIYTDAGNELAYYILFFIACLVLIFILADMRTEKKHPGNNYLINSNFVFEYLVILAMIPNITSTDSEHFLLSIPLIIFMLNYLFNNGRDMKIIIISVIVFLFFGGNWRDLIGKTLASWLTDNGILGLSNIFIIAISLYIFFNQRKAELLSQEIRT